MIVKTATATEAATATLSVEEYIALEEAQLERRFEYIDGEILEMTGGTDNHSNIIINVVGAMFNQLYFTNCRLRGSDMRIRISADRFVYPDISVVCGAPHLQDNRTTLLNPVMTVEVTSPSSRRYDRGEKRDYYTSLPSLQAYLVIDQHRVFADLQTREGRRWQLEEYNRLSDVVEIEALGCRLPLAEIYRDILVGTG